jgi:putative redox protein
MREYKFKYLGGRHFYSKTPSGHDIHSDSSIDNGGHDCAPSPMELMFAGLAGCTGIDVTMILEKMKVPFENLEIRVQPEAVRGEITTYPKIHLIYEFTGNDLQLKKLERAVELSQNKYCTASAIFKGVSEISYEIIIK